MKQHSTFSAIRNAFYPQPGIGISANTFLLCLNIAAVLVGNKPRLTDLPITHLALTHIFMLLTMDLLISRDIWETQDIPVALKCKVLVFLHKVMRGLSICTTCVLSVLQAITISLHDSWDIFLTLMALSDVFFVSLMVLSSGYIIILLYTHKQRPMTLHSSGFSPKTSPQQRATHTILQLISCFSILYCADFFISLFIGMTWTNNPILVCLHMLVDNGYGSVSPLVLIGADTQIIKVMQTKCRNKDQFLTKLI
ncbi:vomeronasal type-1 receptor 5-like [Marmota monax]|uniref:vomeronasal type-1 receptor 5-like n=1 Tax=Marmota monax TaxID=9995 RepID=UPI001EB050BC|nr:vomeronasal type-1 receptor 5-like [Marmota monax]